MDLIHFRILGFSIHNVHRYEITTCDWRLNNTSDILILWFDDWWTGSQLNLIDYIDTFSIKFDKIMLIHSQLNLIDYVDTFSIKFDRLYWN